MRLIGETVELEPLDPAHVGDLIEATRDGELWRLPFTTVPSPDEMRAEIERRRGLERAGTMVPFAVRERATNAVVGMTTYMNIDWTLPRLEIGMTWYRARVQRTRLNTEAKLLLLTHAFESLHATAVEFRTSRDNLASQRAIQRLGATRDGTLRSHRRHRDGAIADTFVYSITADEWPAVRTRLRALAAPRSTDGR